MIGGLLRPRRAGWYGDRVRALLAASLALAACGGDPASHPAERAATARARTEAAQPDEDRAAEDRAAEDPMAAAAPTAPEEPDFEAPLPEEPCAATLVRIAHRHAELPPVLHVAVALRSEDGRHVRLILSDHELEQGDHGRFADPAPGRARFELDARRTYRRPLEPGVLGPPDARRGALTHVRIVTAGPFLTFGHRDIGRVELTELSATRVCGRVDLDDGSGRVRGGFTARVLGPLPR